MLAEHRDRTVPARCEWASEHGLCLLQMHEAEASAETCKARGRPVVAVPAVAVIEQTGVSVADAQLPGWARQSRHAGSRGEQRNSKSASIRDRYVQSYEASAARRSTWSRLLSNRPTRLARLRTLVPRPVPRRPRAQARSVRLPRPGQCRPRLRRAPRQTAGSHFSALAATHGSGVSSLDPRAHVSRIAWANVATLCRIGGRQGWLQIRWFRRAQLPVSRSRSPKRG